MNTYIRSMDYHSQPHSPPANSASSPLRNGRTAQRRAKRIIRTGAHALEEAKERAVTEKDNLEDVDFTKRARGRGDNEAVAADRSSSISSRRRHKHPKASRYSSFPTQREFYFLASSLGTPPNGKFSSCGHSHTTEEHNFTNITKGIASQCAPKNLAKNMFGGSSGMEKDRNLSQSQKLDLSHPKKPVEPGGESVEENPDSPEVTTTVRLSGRGFCRDATTAQDIGNYRMLIDDLSYLCSAIIQCRKKSLGCEGSLASIYKHTSVTAGAICDIAELISLPSTRSKMLSVFARLKSSCGEIEGVRVGAMEAVLESIACAPNVLDVSIMCRRLIEGHSSMYGNQLNVVESSSKIETIDNTEVDVLERGKHPKKTVAKKEQRKYDIISSKALSIVSYFVGVDCTNRSSILSQGASNRPAVQMVRECVLQHKSALQGIARLVANDPVVHAYLHKPSVKASGLSMTRSSLPARTVLHQADDGEIALNVINDPTILGRRSRTKKYADEASLYRDEKTEDSSLDFIIAEEELHPKLELQNADKYVEKIALSMSRTKVSHQRAEGSLLLRQESQGCTYCNNWMPIMIPSVDSDYITSASNLALLAAEYIITGRYKCSAEDDAADEYHVEDADECHIEENDLCASQNPIVHANEMLRLSGSLPHYSRSMSETLVAILVSFKNTGFNGKSCSTCTSYLHQRASSLSELIDSLCCLSPSVSIALSPQESNLVPSLLRAVAELSFVIEDKQSSLQLESTLTVLKTLTSLTHENSVACDQMLNSYCWKIPLPASGSSRLKGQITGLDIVFSYLFQTATHQSNISLRKICYDNIIFCLNILTNIVEMVPNPTKSMIERIVVDELFIQASTGTAGISWLARWIVSKTLGFQDSVMRGSFGSETETTPVDINELKSGEEDNLVTSGNGFVLLACLMIDEFPSKSIRDRILKEVPSDRNDNSGGIQFIIKTLKAFCNFYHFSVGDLSVAVIAPVIKLIAGLEQMDL